VAGLGSGDLSRALRGARFSQSASHLANEAQDLEPV
jgi:hypothetical protein